MKKKHIIFVIIIVLIIISGIAAAILKNNKALAADKASKIALYTIPEKEKIFVNGVILPEKTESIYLDASKGAVNKVSITNGQTVKAGDVLFTYKNDQITDQIDQANQQINSLNSQKKKLSDKLSEAKKLLAKQQDEAKAQAAAQAKAQAAAQAAAKAAAQASPATQPAQTGVDSSASISSSLTAGTEAQISGYQDQIDALQSQIDSYQDQVKKLKTKEFTNVTAPIDGKVILSDSDKDMTKLYIVIEAASFYIKGSCNEKDQIKLKENQAADIFVFSINKTLTGKVKSIGNRPAAAELSAQTAAGGSSSISNYDVSISLDSQEGLINGFHVQATIKLTEAAMKIPKTSILDEAGKKFVFKAVDKKLTKQEITYEESTSPEVVVLTGLKENDSITVNTKDMKEGMAVE